MYSKEETKKRLPPIFSFFMLQLLNNLILILLIADCAGGDKEMKPYQIPVDYYTHGVSCGECEVIIPDPWYEKVKNKVLSFE